MQIAFSYDSSAASAPAGFTTALNYVASVLDALITDNVTVKIAVGWGEANGAAIQAGILGEGGYSPGNYLSYGQFVSALQANADSVAAHDDLAALPANASAQVANTHLFATVAQQKAWGQLAANTTEVDGAIGFGTAYTYTFDPNNRGVVGAYDFIGIAEHEITHALGRLAGNGAYTLANYTAPGVLNTGSVGGYYSLDGGVTNLGNFSTSSADPGDWGSASGDAFNYLIPSGTALSLSFLDQTLLATLGFSVAGTQFLVADQTIGTSSVQNGIPYSGPVSGLTQQYVYAGLDNLNITAHAPNSFIHTGGGNDAIDVSTAGGNNVLDGSTGSNFLTGGAGSDTFFVDARNVSAAIWSTINGVHAGDSVTVWGVTQSDFALSWLNGQGAAGATGLTSGFTAAGKPDVNLTIAGYTTADLSDGRLSVTFGSTPDEPDLPGSVYMNIKAA